MGRRSEQKIKEDERTIEKTYMLVTSMEELSKKTNITPEEIAYNLSRNIVLKEKVKAHFGEKKSQKKIANRTERKIIIDVSVYESPYALKTIKSLQKDKFGFIVAKSAVNFWNENARKEIPSRLVIYVYEHDRIVYIDKTLKDVVTYAEEHEIQLLTSNKNQYREARCRGIKVKFV